MVRSICARDDPFFASVNDWRYTHGSHRFRFHDIIRSLFCSGLKSGLEKVSPWQSYAPAFLRSLLVQSAFVFPWPTPSTPPPSLSPCSTFHPWTRAQTHAWISF